MKPRPPAIVKKGKSLGAHKGLADTINWLVRFCTNLRGDGQTVRLENPLGDHPVITAPGADGGSVTGNTAGSTRARGDLNVYSAADSCVEVLTDSATGSVTIGVYYI